MFEFPYIEPYKKLESVLKAAVEGEIPAKFTYRCLAGMGFPSSKDRDFVPAFRLLGLIDDLGRPTARYTDLRDLQQFERVLSQSVREAYVSLFEVDAKADSVSENVLIGYFGKLTGKSHQQANIYARTFKELVRLSNYNEIKEIPFEEITQAALTDQRVPSTIKTRGQNINLNINLPTTTDGKVYETLFKHLKDLLTLE